MTRFSLAVAITAALITGALAQSGTPEDQRACNASVQRYCVRAIQGGDMAILGCLQENRARIAPACRQVLVKYGQ